MGKLYFFIFFIICSLEYEYSQAEILSPPFFNLAEGKKIVATATCGEDFNGPETFCYKSDNSLTEREVCDFCDSKKTENNYSPDNAIDDTESWWQSPPLSRGQQYEHINLTINLGQAFTVGYVIIRPGRSARPIVWVLEKSQDYGETWSPWQYFADSSSACVKYFGIEANQPIINDKSVICSTEFSNEKSFNIQIPIISRRPSEKQFYNSLDLQDWTTATNVRFQFLKMEDFSEFDKKDYPKHYFYTIKDIKIGGRCICNGHADSCEYFDSNPSSKMYCQCKHFTCGLHCETCCPDYKGKSWKSALESQDFVCEP